MVDGSRRIGIVVTGVSDDAWNLGVRETVGDDGALLREGDEEQLLGADLANDDGRRLGARVRAAGVEGVGRVGGGRVEGVGVGGGEGALERVAALVDLRVGAGGVEHPDRDGARAEGVQLVELAVVVGVGAVDRHDEVAERRRRLQLRGVEAIRVELHVLDDALLVVGRVDARLALVGERQVLPVVEEEEGGAVRARDALDRPLGNVDGVVGVRGIEAVALGREVAERQRRQAYNLVLDEIDLDKDVVDLARDVGARRVRKVVQRDERWLEAVGDRGILYNTSTRVNTRERTREREQEQATRRTHTMPLMRALFELMMLLIEVYDVKLRFVTFNECCSRWKLTRLNSLVSPMRMIDTLPTGSTE